eukprot:jgi/Mesvir1/14236/Mv26576-RA.1
MEETLLGAPQVSALGVESAAKTLSILQLCTGHAGGPWTDQRGHARQARRAREHHRLRLLASALAALRCRGAGGGAGDQNSFPLMPRDPPGAAAQADPRDRLHDSHGVTVMARGMTPAPERGLDLPGDQQRRCSVAEEAADLTTEGDGQQGQGQGGATTARARTMSPETVPAPLICTGPLRSSADGAFSLLPLGANDAASVVRQVLDDVTLGRSTHDQGHARTRHRLRVLRRASLVGDLLGVYAALPDDARASGLTFQFEGEPAADHGGVYIEVFTTFFERMLDPSMGYFSTCGAENVGTSPDGDDAEVEASPWAPTVLPASGAPPEHMPHYRTLGRMLLQCLVDQIPLPWSLAPYFFKFLLLPHAPPTVDDLRSFDPWKAASASLILAATEEELAGMCVFMDPVCMASCEQTIAEGGSQCMPRVAGGASALPPGDGTACSGELVTCANRQQYIGAVVAHELVERRRAALTAIRGGMLLGEGAAVFQQLSRLTPEQLQLAACGPRRVDKAALCAALYFPPPTTSRSQADTDGTRQRLLSLIEGWPPGHLSQLLRFVTGYSTLPVTGLHNARASPPDKIKVTSCSCAERESRTAPARSWADVVASGSRSKQEHVLRRPCYHLPVASTCLWVLKLPRCASEQVLESRLLRAFEWGGQHFGLI